MAGLPEERRRPLLATVRQLRKDGEAAFAERLRTYGLFASCASSHARHTRDCYVVPLERLPLSEPDRLTRERLEVIIEREAVGYADVPPSEQTRLAIERYLYEAASTLFNRLAALRAMEVRNLIVETVVRRPDFGGLSRREYVIARSRTADSPHDVLAAALRAGFEDAAQHVGMLFEADDPYGLLLPEPRRLIELLEVFGQAITEPDWRADDILGWLYQYYQDEAREQFRRGRGRGARRTADADELAAINCLYTPHWVVRALVDNSLGRLIADQSEQPEAVSAAVRDYCGYLLPDPADTHGEARDLRSIRVLDPASGSGHFLIYAFDVLWRAYRALDPDGPPEEHAVAILQHNLYGIDIDLRACQLAALGLYLKAKEHAPDMKPVAVNIVCADIRLLDGPHERAFLAEFANDAPLRRIAERLVQDLRYTAEIGSLLRVRGSFERLFTARRAANPSQGRLLEGGPPEQLQLEGVIARDKTLAEILGAIARFERQAVARSDMGGQLFASDAERSVGLLSTLAESYDVVVMNPPYNKRQELPLTVRDYLAEHYELTQNNIYAAFIEQAVNLCRPGGYVGCLTPLAYLYLRQLRRLRTDLLGTEAPPELVLEFGWDILDPAQIQTAGSVLRRAVDGAIEPDRARAFFDLTGYAGSAAKQRAFDDALGGLRSNGEAADYYSASLSAMAIIPGSPYAYWLPAPVRNAFSAHTPLDRDNAGLNKAAKIADVKQGLATADDARFTRRWWEVAPEQLGRHHWAPFVKGEEYARWYHDPSLVVLWEREGEEIREFRDAAGRVRSRPQAIEYYFHEGLTWQLVNVGRRVRTRYLPPGCIFSHKGPSIFVCREERNQLFSLLGFLNSSLANIAMLALTPERGWEVGQVSLLPVAPDVLRSAHLADIARELHDLHLAWDTGDETSTRFVSPHLLQVAFPDNRPPATGHPLAESFQWPVWSSWREVEAICASPEASLTELLTLVAQRDRMVEARIVELEADVDDEVFRCYGLSEQAADVRAALQRRLGVAADDEDGSDGEAERVDTGDDRAALHRLLSHYARRAVAESEDGIVPWHPLAGDGLVSRVRRLIAREWGDVRANRLEDEVASALGRSLEDWLTVEWFPFHCRLYRNRPPVWLLWSAPRSRGRGRPRLPGFACFLDYHRLSRDMLQLVRGRHLARAIDEARAEAERVEVRATEARLAGGSQASRILRAAEDARALVGELEDFDGRLGAVLDQRTATVGSGSWVDTMVSRVRENGYQPDRDLGIAINLRPLSDASLLHPAADRVS